MLREGGDQDFGTWEHWVRTGVYLFPAGCWERVRGSGQA